MTGVARGRRTLRRINHDAFMCFFFGEDAILSAMTGDATKTSVSRFSKFGADQHLFPHHQRCDATASAFPRGFDGWRFLAGDGFEKCLVCVATQAITDSCGWVAVAITVAISIPAVVTGIRGWAIAPSHHKQTKEERDPVRERVGEWLSL